MSTTALSPRQGPSAAHVVQLLQTAYPKHWENHIRNFLSRNNLGDIAPADLPAAELARFTDHVFWLVKQTGLREPAAWLAHHRAQEANMAPVAPVQLETPVEIAGDLPVQRDSVELEPVKLRGDLAKTSGASPPTSVTATVTNRTTKAELLPLAKAAMSEAEGPKTEATPLGAKGRKQGRGGGRHLKKQKLPADVSKAGRKLSLERMERMQIVLDSLREYPVLSHAARKAGIHRKTLEYWMRCSAAGDDGYDIKYEGLKWRFHEHCQIAIEEAHDKTRLAAWKIAMGGVVYKNDEFLLSLGCEGPDALKDENGIPVLETVRKANPKMISKMIRFLLELLRPDKYGKHRKIDVPHHGVLVIGDADSDKPKNSSAASVKARKWKAAMRMIRETKA
jgi:hypothetical protein